MIAERLATFTERVRQRFSLCRQRVFFDVARWKAVHDQATVTLACPCGRNEWRYWLKYETVSVLECSGCGLKRNFPPPATGVCGAAYQDANDSMGLHPHQRFLLDLIIAFAGKRRELKCLDIGCSTGNLLIHLRQVGFGSLYGIELDAHAFLKAQAKGLNAWNVPLDKISSGQRFDLIYLNHVLEHIPDLTGFIVSLREHIAENGCVFVAVPNIGSSYACRADWIGLQPTQHLWHFEKKTLNWHMSRNGFRIVAEHTLSGRAGDRNEGDNLIQVFEPA